MNHIIQQIVDADREAQALVGEARKEQLQVNEEIAAESELFRTRYMERSKQKIESKMQPIEAQAEKKWKQTEEQLLALKAQLQEKYEQCGEDWVSEIVNRVIGREPK